MHFGRDFFLWFKFAVELFRVLVKIFGDEDDQIEANRNGLGTKTDSPGK